MVLVVSVAGLPKAILVPSGDQVGSNSSPESSGIISRGVPPSDETRYNFAFWRFSIA